MRVGLALAAMLAQVFFSTAHMAAMAATIAGPLTLTGTPAGSLGLLEICTANGLLTISPDGSIPAPARHSSNPSEQCPVCASAVVDAFSGADIQPVIAITAVELILPQPSAQVLRPAAACAALPIRAPPLG